MILPNYCKENLGDEGIRAYGANVRPVPSPDDVGPNAEKFVERHGLPAVKSSKARNRATRQFGVIHLDFAMGIFERKIRRSRLV